jgi:hypothetical protein
MGVSPQTINAIETERYTQSLPLAISLARHFSHSVEEVFDADVKDTYCRSRWVMPAFALALGGVFAVAQWIGGHPAAGAASFGIMAAFAALLVVLEGRSGAVAIMRRPARDERARNIDLAGTAFAGIVLIKSSSWRSWCSSHAARIRARTPSSALWAASPTSSPWSACSAAGSRR